MACITKWESTLPFGKISLPEYERRLKKLIDPQANDFITEKQIVECFKDHHAFKDIENERIVKMNFGKANGLEWRFTKSREEQTVLVRMAVLIHKGYACRILLSGVEELMKEADWDLKQIIGSIECR